MSLGQAFEQKAKQIAQMEKEHAEALWRAHKAWLIACASALIGGFILGLLV